MFPTVTSPLTDFVASCRRRRTFHRLFCLPTSAGLCRESLARWTWSRMTENVTAMWTALVTLSATNLPTAVWSYILMKGRIFRFTCSKSALMYVYVTFHITLFISQKSNKNCFFIKCAVKTEKIVAINTGLQCDMKIILLQRRIMVSYLRHAFIHVMNTSFWLHPQISQCMFTFAICQNSFSTKLFQMLEISIINIPKRIILKMKTNNWNSL